MRTWESLAQEAESLHNQVYHWPSPFPERIQNALASFDSLCITRLEALLLSPLSDQNKNIKIRRLFSMRWTVVANTSLDYTLNPTLPSNAWYLALATRIAGPEEAIVQILMPTVERVIGTSEDDVRLSTELLGRHICLNNFFLNTNQDALIAIDDVFDYAKQDTHYLFPAIQMNENVDVESVELKNKNLFPLTATDRAALRKITPEAMQFFDLLKQMHAIRYSQKPSIGFALFELHEALLRSSKMDLGADLAANMSECQQPIVDFYHIWMSLSDSDKNKISNYRARGGSETLYGFLLTLFSYTPGIELSDADYAAVDPLIIPCTHMIGQQLKTLLAQNIALYNMPLPGRARDFYLEIVPTDDELNEAKEKCIQSLSQRQLIAGADDSKIVSFMPFFSAFTDHLLEDANISQQILSVLSQIKNISDLKYPLLLLPEEKWDHLLLLVRDNILNQVRERDRDVVQGEAVALLSQILKSMPSHSWVSFFEALFAQKYDFFMEGDSLPTLLYEFNNVHWNEIVRTMGQYPAAILAEPKDIAYLLDATHIEHYKTMIDLFHAPIVSTLNTPRDYAELFESTSREIWPQIFVLFSRILIYFIQNKKLIDEVLEILNPDRRLSFIRLLIVSGVNRTDIIKNLPYILPHIDTLEWGEIFRIAQINYPDYPSTPIEFLSVLTTLNVESWRHLNIFFDDGIHALIGDPEKLGFILKNLPIDKWQPFFLHFFSQRKEITSDFFAACLAEVAEKNRLKLIELILRSRPSFSLQSGYFADALNLISPDDWNVLVGFFTQHTLKTTFSSVLNIQQFLKKIPVEKWDAVKKVFSSYFNTALHDETALIMVARELPFDKIPAFFGLVSDVVKKHITDLGYLKAVFFHVPDQNLASLISLSVAEQVKKFEINARELIAVSACAEAMQLGNILSSVFEIFGKAEMIRYINSHFLFFPGHDPSQLESWKLLNENSHLRIVDFTKFTASFAMIFYLVPVHDWPMLVDLFSDLFKMKMRDVAFLRDFLWFLPIKNRLALCSKLIHCFNEYDLSFGGLHHVFATLSEKDCQAFLLLIKEKNPAMKIEDFHEFTLMVGYRDISSFKKWYSLLGGQIDALIAQPADLAKLFCLFQEGRWPVVAEICQLRIIEQLQKVDFLKNTLRPLNPVHRFLFLKAVSPYFDRIPVNAAIMIDVFSMLAFNYWVDIVKLFGKEVLSRAIANESDLAFILHGLSDNQLNFLQAVQHYLPLIRLDHPGNFVRLLESFENCSALLLNLFRKKLPEILGRFISNFMIQDDLKIAVTNHEKSLFNALVIKLLPILLSISYFKEIFDSRDMDDFLLLEKICVELRSIEMHAALPDSTEALQQKLKMADEFIQDVEKDAVREKSEFDILSFAVRERLRSKLIAHFGLHFFHKIPQYATCLQEPLVPPGIRPNRVAFFPQRNAAPIAPVPTRLYPMPDLPQSNAGAAIQPQGIFLENLFWMPPRPL